MTPTLSVEKYVNKKNCENPSTEPIKESKMKKKN
jgi:hypothetical protein